ncbi:hypothetical protein BDR03DRAFT_643329 [Suillus americanus]|nr:hypothetical protein BDR03DRAFT_643329 [Suillus americanus]
MRKGNSSKNSTQETPTSSETIARGSSHRPRGRFGQLLEKVKDSASKLRVSRSKVPAAIALLPRMCFINVLHRPRISSRFRLRLMWKWRLIPNRYFGMHNSLYHACIHCWDLR